MTRRETHYVGDDCPGGHKHDVSEEVYMGGVTVPCPDCREPIMHMTRCYCGLETCSRCHEEHVIERHDEN